MSETNETAPYKWRDHKAEAIEREKLRLPWWSEMAWAILFLLLIATVAGITYFIGRLLGL
jgi:hypothetical protein